MLKIKDIKLNQLIYTRFSFTSKRFLKTTKSRSKASVSPDGFSLNLLNREFSGYFLGGTRSK